MNQLKTGTSFATLMLAFVAASATAQALSERGAFVGLLGTDTVLIDRFDRTVDTLRGSVAVKNQPRVEYVMALGPRNGVRSLEMDILAANATATQGRLHIDVRMSSDSAIVTMGTTSTRVATTPGAIPSFNNAFAITEIFMRRARSTSGSGDYVYLNVPGGQSIPVTVRPLGADSLIFSIVGQEQHYRVDPAGRILGGVIVGQPVRVVRVSGREADAITWGLPAGVPIEEPDYSAPQGAPYTAEEVSFTGPAGIKLGGTLTMPKGARGKVPAAITITGSGQEDRDEYIQIAGGVRLFRQVADTLSRVGIAVLRLDDRGVGASGGDFATSTTADFADDVRAALAYLRSRPDIDGDRIALIGHSEGGLVAPMVAASDPRVRAIVTFGGPGDKMIELSMAQHRWILDHTPSLTPVQRDSLLLRARASLAPEKQTSPALKFWMSYDPAPAARQVKAATLILQGETDRQVPKENAEKLAALIRSGGNKDVTVRIFPATDHLFLEDSTGDFMDMYAHLKTNKVSPLILGTMADWLVKELGVRAN